ncbi:MAG TPA: TonB family protein [Prolixibacteraceae bacterium]|nr:TonB family protein [Prolixibacteraceae bacterium]
MKINYFLLFLLFFNALSAQNSQTYKVEPAPEENHWHVKNFLGDTLNYRSEYFCKEVLNDSNLFTLYANGKLFLDGDIVHYYNSGKEKVIIPYKQNKVDGVYKEFYPSGKLKQKSTWKNNKRHGPLVLFREDGSKKVEANFSDGFKEGKEIIYYPNGNKKTLLNYTKGLLHGRQKTFKPNGRKKEKYYYEYNNDASLEGLSENEYFKAPKLIELPVALSNIELLLANNRLPDIEKKNQLQNVEIQCLIDTNGKVKEVSKVGFSSEKNISFISALLKESAPMDPFYFDSTPIDYYLWLSLYFYNGEYVGRDEPFKQGVYLSNDFGNDFWYPICYFDARKPELEEENQEKNNNSKYAGFDFSKEAEIMPGFPGGKEALRQYISECLIYPRAAAKKGEEGKVFVGFIIDVDGSIKNVHIERGVSKILDAEAVRVVKSMPKWKPAFDGKGKPVPFSHFIPVNFRLK